MQDNVQIFVTTCGPWIFERLVCLVAPLWSPMPLLVGSGGQRKSTTHGCGSAKTPYSCMMVAFAIQGCVSMRWLPHIFFHA